MKDYNITIKGSQYIFENLFVIFAKKTQTIIIINYEVKRKKLILISKIFKKEANLQ